MKPKKKAAREWWLVKRFGLTPGSVFPNEKAALREDERLREMDTKFGVDHRVEIVRVREVLPRPKNRRKL